MTDGSPYRAALVKRRRPPVADAPKRTAVRAVAAEPTAEDRAAEIADQHASRIEAEATALRRVEAMTRAWNDELSSTVPAVASVVSRAVRSIVGEAPREEVVMNALRREIARVRGEHRPVLRVSREDGEAWTARLRERAATSEPVFDVRPDDALAEGKCLLEIGARRVDITPEAQLDAFDDHLRNGVGAIAPRPAPALPDIGETVPRPAASALSNRTPAPRTDETTPITLGDPKPARRTTHRATRPTTRSISLDKGAASGSGTEVVRSEAKVKPSAGGATKAPSGDVPRTDTAKAAAAPVATRGATTVAEPTRPGREAKVAGPVATAKDTTKPLAADRAAADDDAGTQGAGGLDAPRPSRATDRAVALQPSTAPDDAIDLDSLDLGEGAARFVSRPSSEGSGRAPWIGSIVSAPALADVGIEGGGSRAVAALRERVARTAGDLRRQVSGTEAEGDALADASAADGPVAQDVAERRETIGDSAVAPDASDARDGDTLAPEPVETPAADEPVDRRTGDTSDAPALHADTFPPFASHARGLDSPAERSDTTNRTRNEAYESTDDERGGRGAGDGVRAALAGKRRRSRAERVGDETVAVADVPEPVQAGGRSSRLPPRIAELIAKRRPAR